MSAIAFPKEMTIEDICPETNGKHQPDPNTIHIESDGGDFYINVDCGRCSRSGCIVKLDVDRIDW